MIIGNIIDIQENSYVKSKASKGENAGTKTFIEELKNDEDYNGDNYPYLTTTHHLAINNK